MAAIFDKRIAVVIASAIIVVSLASCEPASNTNQASQTTVSNEPAIEVSPVQQGEGPWKIATGDNLTLTVTAPGARTARVFYRPVVATDRIVVLKKLNAPADGASGIFSSQLKLVPDFAGDIWAEAAYPDGSKKETQPILLAAEGAASTAPDIAADAAHGAESERSDKFTGGKIETTALVENQPDIKITVNVPAFRLTLWQDGKEVKTYEIGVGRKDFPIGIGMRKATQVIWNPEWVPPDSEWIEDYKYEVQPGERIEADDPRNPLGKLKVPLGEGYLIHQAAKPSDIGHLVSHGCIRMLKDDLFDLAEKIVAARGWLVSKQQIEQAKSSKERLAVKLDPPLLIDINYDTQVVEGGILRIYPDVYARNTNTVENLRAELQSAGVDASSIDDQVMRQMLDRANANEAFVVSIADLRTGNMLAAGRTEPLTSQSVAKSAQPKGKSRRGTQGR